MVADSLLRGILDQTFEGVLIVDRERRILVWNPAAEQITGFKQEEAISTFCYQNKLEHSDQDGCVLCHTACPLEATMRDGTIRETQVFFHHKQGYRVPVRVRNVPIRQHGRIVAAAQLFHDISIDAATERRLSELERLSRTDALTQLPNRRALEATLRRRMEELRRYGTPLGVALIDVDRFKQVNDVYGHEVGDRVLRTVASTLQRNTRSVDTVGRWGGDEFLAIVPNITFAGLDRTLQRLRVLVSVSQITVGDHKVGATVSIGATLATTEESWTNVLTRADKALYESKRKGRNHVTTQMKSASAT